MLVTGCALLVISQFIRQLTRQGKRLSAQATAANGELTQRTVLIIAHRISTIEHADKVIVLDFGRVVETGTVTQLLAAEGLFSRFYALQLRNRHSGEESRAEAVPAQ
jgi:ABC-type multidrug transport system ATPase subunit